MIIHAVRLQPLAQVRKQATETGKQAREQARQQANSKQVQLNTSKQASN